MSNHLELLTPHNSQVLFIDQQPQMAFGVQSIDRQMLKNNVVALAKAAKVFNVPTTITTVETEGFSGHTYPELLAVFPGNKILERTSMNSWDDHNVRDALAANGRKKVVVSGLWTEVRNLMFALSAMKGWLPDRHGSRTPRAAPRPTRQVACYGPHRAGGRGTRHAAAGVAKVAARLGARRPNGATSKIRAGALRRLRHGRGLPHRLVHKARSASSTASAWAQPGEVKIRPCAHTTVSDRGGSGTFRASDLLGGRTEQFDCILQNRK